MSLRIRVFGISLLDLGVNFSTSHAMMQMQTPGFGEPGKDVPDLTAFTLAS